MIRNAASATTAGKARSRDQLFESGASNVVRAKTPENLSRRQKSPPKERARHTSIPEEIKTEIEDKCKQFSGGVTWQKYVSSMEELYDEAAKAETDFFRWTQGIADATGAKVYTTSMTKTEIDSLNEAASREVKTHLAKRPTLASPLHVRSEAPHNQWYRCTSVVQVELVVSDGIQLQKVINLMTEPPKKNVEQQPKVRELRFKTNALASSCAARVEMPGGHICAVSVCARDVREQDDASRTKGHDGQTITEESTGNFLLHQCKHGDVEEIERLMRSERHTFNIDFQDKHDKTGLHHAVLGRHEPVMRLLIERHADLSLKDQNGCTPLLLAVERAYMNAIWLLVSSGASIFSRRRDGKTLLQLAMNNEATAKDVINVRDFFTHYLHGPKSDEATEKLLDELDAKRPDIAKLRELLMSGANLLVSAQEHGPVLHRAIQRFYTEPHLPDVEHVHAVVLFLVNQEADVAMVDGQGLTCVDALALTKQWSIAESVMLETGMQVKAPQPFIESIKKGVMADFRRLLLLRPDGVQEPRGLLDLAIREQHFSEPQNMAELLFLSGAKLEHPDELLRECVEGGKDAALQAVLRYSADPNAPAKANKETFVIEVGQGQHQLVAKIASKIDGQNKLTSHYHELCTGDEFLHTLDKHDRILTHDARDLVGLPLPIVLAFSRQGETPLDLAIKCRQAECARLLSAAGGHVCKTDVGHLSLQAAFEGDLDLVRTLCASNVAMDPPPGVDRFGRAPLHLAAYGGFCEIMRVMLEAKANVNAQETMGQTPLDTSFLRGINRNPCMDLLKRLSGEFKVVQPDKALRRAAKDGNTEDINLLLPFVTNVDARDSKTGKTALLLSAQHGQVEAFRALQSANASLETLDTHGFSAMDLCVKVLLAAKATMEHEERTSGKMGALSPEMKALLTMLVHLEDSNVSLNFYRKSHKAVIGYDEPPCACPWCRVRVTTLLYESVRGPTCAARAADLISLGAEVEPLLLGSRPFSPLHHAASYGDTALIQELLKGKANVDREMEQSGYTPLHLAIMEGHLDALKVLLENGADKNLKSKNNLTALDMAKKYRHETYLKRKMIELL